MADPPGSGPRRGDLREVRAGVGQRDLVPVWELETSAFARALEVKEALIALILDMEAQKACAGEAAGDQYAAIEGVIGSDFDVDASPEGEPGVV